MQIDKIIKELRLENGMTQEQLADLLGVSMQSVSRWETGICCPDITLLPIIANIFNVNTDKLLGYESERDKKIEKIINNVNSYGIKGRSDDLWIEECLNIVRCGLVEFPQNEKLMMCLADTLYESGYRKLNSHFYYDESGYLQYKAETHKSNEYWREAIKLCETLIRSSKDNEIFTKATFILVDLYNLLGNSEKAVMYASKMPELKYSKESLLTLASTGKEFDNYNKELLFKLADTFAKQTIHGIKNNLHNYELDNVVTKIRRAISIFNIISENEDFGNYHSTLIQMYLYLSRVEFEKGLKDDCFISLDNALKHARKLEKLVGNESITNELSNDWPWWQLPDYSEVEKEIKKDCRWVKWVKETKN